MKKHKNFSIFFLVLCASTSQLLDGAHQLSRTLPAALPTVMRSSSDNHSSQLSLKTSFSHQSSPALQRLETAQPAAPSHQNQQDQLDNEVRNIGYLLARGGINALPHIDLATLIAMQVAANRLPTQPTSSRLPLDLSPRPLTRDASSFYLNLPLTRSPHIVSPGSRLDSPTPTFDFGQQDEQQDETECIESSFPSTLQGSNSAPALLPLAAGFEPDPTSAAPITRAATTTKKKEFSTPQKNKKRPVCIHADDPSEVRPNHIAIRYVISPSLSSSQIPSAATQASPKTYASCKIAELPFGSMRNAVHDLSPRFIQPSAPDYGNFGYMTDCP